MRNEIKVNFILFPQQIVEQLFIPGAETWCDASCRGDHSRGHILNLDLSVMIYGHRLDTAAMSKIVYDPNVKVFYF